MSELKSCPFCGGKAIASAFYDLDDLEYMAFEVNDSESIYGEVTCENERCINGWYLSPKDWNIRPIEDALNARIAELEGIVKADNLRLINAGLSAGLYSGCDTAEMMAEEILASRARIAELEEKKRWIPVSERLPEDGEIVWLWDGNNLGMGYYLIFSGCFMDRDTPLRRIKVTHWMPLPQPPEVQE